MMPVQELGPHFQFASWRVSQFPRTIEYPLDVMEEIRAFACDELLQLSHGGEEVGGILFGTRRDDLLRILTWRPIACDHTRGEGLLLSYNDRMNLAVQLEVARQNPDLKDLRPLGWFVSHSRDGVSLSASDLEIYNGFFPEASQVALVICPQTGGRAKAGFFVREAEDKVQTKASYLCFELEPMPAIAANPVNTNPADPNPNLANSASERAEQIQRPQPTPVAQPAPSPQVAPASKPAARHQAQSLDPVRPGDLRDFAPPADLIRRTEPIETLPAQSTPIPSPVFQTEEPVPTNERWLWAIPILLALGIAGFMLYQRRAPSPSAAIALRAWSEAQTVHVVWDASSPAIRDSDHAAMEINDGGKSSQISFNADQLHAGKMSYLPQSSDIGFTMTVYPTNGDPIHDYTRLIAPAFSAPSQPPPAPASATPAPPVSENPAPSPDAAQSSPQQSELQQEIQRLKEELSKERARADELQNLVRILENRLGISSTVPKTQRRR